MKKSRFFNLIALSLALFILLPIFASPLCAEEDAPASGQPSDEKDPAEEPSDELVLFDFETETDGWITTGTGGSVTIERDPLADEELPDESCEHCLSVRCDEWLADYSLGVGYDFDAPIDLSGWHALSVSAFFPAGEAENDYLLQVRLTFDDQNTVEESFALAVGEWNLFRLSLSEITASPNLVGIDFLILASDAEEAKITSFYLDCLQLVDPIDKALTERFLFDTFSVSDAEAAFNEEKTALELTLSGKEAILSPSPVSPINVSDQTCLRFRIRNDSNCDQMTLFYTVRTQTETLETKSKSVRLERRSAAAYYDVEIGDLTALCEMECRFSASIGTLTITSIRPSEPYYADAYATCGSLSSCRVEKDLSEITFVGDVSREAALANADGMIEIYRLSVGEDARSFSPTKHDPITSGPMSTHFSLTYEIKEDPTALYDRYAAYLVSEDTYALIAPSFRISNPGDVGKSGNVNAAVSTDKKGLIASDLSFVGESGAGQTLLTLDARSLFAASEDPIVETLLGETCLWNREAVEQLDRKWEALTCAGVSCLFEITGTGEELPVNRPLELLCLFAANRYGAENSCAFLIGESANTKRNDETLKKRVSATADELRSASQAITSVDPSLPLYLSVSDLISDEMALTDAWGLDEFLPALASELATEDSFDWRLCLTCEAEQIGERADASEHSLLTAILDRLGLSDRQLLFVDRRFSEWNTQEQIEYVYLSNLISACSDRQIDGYLVDFDAVSLPMSREMIRLALMTKTPEMFEAFSERVLRNAGASDWSLLLTRYEPDKLPVCRKTEGTLSDKLPSKVRGSFAYYAFDSYSAEADLEPCYYTAELSIDKSRDSLLCAKLNRTVYGTDDPVSYLGFGHRYRYAENFALTPIVSVTLMADAPVPRDLKSVDFEIVFCAGDDFYRISAPLTVGELTTLTFDLSRFPGKDKIDAFRFLVNGEETEAITIRLKSLIGYSEELDTEELSEAIAAERRKRKKIEEEDAGSKRWLWIALGTVGALTFLTAVLLSIPREDISENNENEDD